jgi:hypothetical protein
MKREPLLLGVLVLVVWVSGCTKIVQIEPTSGPPGTPVYVKSCNTFGDPAAITLKWDGDKLCDPFCGAFIVPAVNDGGEPGKHRVTLIDNFDASEAFLIFPIFRLHHDTATFIVTPP